MKNTISFEAFKNMSIMDDVRLKQYPQVVLRNCLTQNVKCKFTKSVKAKDFKKSPKVILSNCTETKARNKHSPPVKKRKRCTSCKKSEKVIEDSLNGLLTPVPSTTSSCEEEVSDSEQSNKRMKSEEDSLMEVEKIVGYYRDKRNNTMSYLIKWKNYDSRGNTWEPIENLVNCNKLLMKYFECEEPRVKSIFKMDKEVSASLSKKFNVLRSNATREEILRFPRYGSLDIRKVFDRSFRSYRETLKKEYSYILRCLIGMYNHRDPGMFLRAQHYKIAIKLCEKREKQLKILGNQQKHINKLEECPVKVVNECDFDVLPDVEYITESKPGKGVIIPTEPVMGCECPNGCRPSSKCCGVLNESEFVYNLDKKLKKCRDIPIYECNKKCRCSEDCPNRVVQKGRKKKLAIFKTEKCGWGVKTLEMIKEGEFVCEYVGELISDSESNAREVDYCPKNLSYMFNLDFTPNGEEAPFVLDATHCGNLSRYLNHSCDPNVEVRVVWIDCIDRDKPRLAFFAKRRIKKGEELSFEYTSNEKQSGFISRTRCYCDKSNCREWIWGI